MKIVMHPLFVVFLIAAFLCGFGLVAVALLAAVVIHEFSHSMVASHFGVRTSKMRLLPFGAEISIDCAFLPVDKKVLILLAGPLGNIVLAIVFSSLLWLFPQFFLVFEIIIIANAIPGIMNLLPIYPLDGGKILHICLGEKRWTILISNAFFVILFIASCLFFFNIALLIMCIMMIININFDLKATEYAVYIKTLDKFCVDFMKNNTILEHEE